MSYKHKYLKYKKKYLMITKQYGGKLRGGWGDDVEISGPCGCFIYTITGTVNKNEIEKTIYLFHDKHGSYDNLCNDEEETCVFEKDCYPISDFMRIIMNRNLHKNLNNTYNNRIIDIFTEQTYTYQKEMYKTPVTYRIQEAKDEFLNLMVSFGIPRDILTKTFPLPSVKRGPLVDSIWRDYECMRYGEKEETTERINCLKYTYFHRVDYREETSKFFSVVQRFLSRIINRSLEVVAGMDKRGEIDIHTTEINKLKDYLSTYLAENKPNEFNFLNALNYLAQKYKLSRTDNEDTIDDADIDKRIFDIVYEDPRIDKQLKNVTLGKDRFKKILDMYINKRLPDTNKSFLRMRYRTLIKGYRETITKNIEKMIRDTNNLIVGKISFILHVMSMIESFASKMGIVLMDVYAMCRMFREFTDGHTPKYIIFYAGGGHIDNYDEMIQNIKSEFTELTVSKHVDIPKQTRRVNKKIKVDRCVTIDEFDKNDLLDMNI